jgi:DNA gyrase/topoisomerase IV subunit B
MNAHTSVVTQKGSINHLLPAIMATAQLLNNTIVKVLEAQESVQAIISTEVLASINKAERAALVKEMEKFRQSKDHKPLIGHGTTCSE